VAELATSGYFVPRARHRLVVLLTDGESARFVPRDVADVLHEGRVRLLVVRLWHADEGIYGAGGKRDRGYQTRPASLGPLRRLASETGAGRVFGENEPGAVVHAARRLLGKGPTRAAGGDRLIPIAPYAVLAAVVPFLLLLRLRDPRGGRLPTVAPQQASQQPSRRQLARPSLTATAAMSRAAAGSAHHQPRARSAGGRRPIQPTADR
jgi:hypothetical protein